MSGGTQDNTKKKSKAEKKMEEKKLEELTPQKKMEELASEMPGGTQDNTKKKSKAERDFDPKKKMEELASELAKINKELDKTRDGGKKRGSKEIESGGLTAILDSLTRAVEHVKTILEKGSEDNCPRVKELEAKTRSLEDSSDSHQQRSMRGKFLVSSLKENNVILSEDKLKGEGKSLPKYVVELLFRKLGVRAKEEEIVSCHHTNSGMLIFRLADFKPGSTFQQVVNAIKNGAGKDVHDLFVNFALTPRRAALLYEVRQLKRAKKISKFHTDFDGTITVVQNDGTKMKITNYVEKTNQMGAGGSKIGAGGSYLGKTMTKEELLARFTA